MSLFLTWGTKLHELTPWAFQETSDTRWYQTLDQKFGHDVSERKRLCVRWRKKTYIVYLVVVVWTSKCSSLLVTDSSGVSLIQIYLIILSDHTRCSFIYLMVMKWWAVWFYSQWSQSPLFIWVIQVTVTQFNIRLRVLRFPQHDRMWNESVLFLLTIVLPIVSVISLDFNFYFYFLFDLQASVPFTRNAVFNLM